MNEPLSKPFVSCTCRPCQHSPDHREGEQHRRMKLLASQLSGVHRRLYAAVETHRIGFRSCARVSQITGVGFQAISRGRAELALLLAGRALQQPKGRPGRPAIDKTYPDIHRTLQQLLSDDTAGDPMTDKVWVRTSSRTLSKRLAELGYTVNYHTICRLLREMGYSMMVNVKKRASTTHSPRRDSQFEYIAQRKAAFLASGSPVISVDCKKKELIGYFRASGRSWCAKAIHVNEHSFASLAQCVAAPYGIYDILTNAGYVWVSTSRDTPASAVTAIKRWWFQSGRSMYPNAKELLILADSGGSNSCRSRAWKYRLQSDICDPCDLTVTVCHYPTGCSKYNPIERRLFSHISMNWLGKPLINLEVMLGYIRGTTTQSGLTVQAFMMDEEFTGGQRVSTTEMDTVAIHSHDTCPNWNYTIQPRSTPGGLRA